MSKLNNLLLSFSLITISLYFGLDLFERLERRSNLKKINSKFSEEKRATENVDNQNL